MKSSKRQFVFLVVGLVMGFNLVADHQLSHICAYSNQSVVRFRGKTLQSKKVAEIKHPGIHFDWPVDLCQFWISSLYGMRQDPNGNKRMHNGIDLAAVSGTNVKSASDGTVVSVNTLMPGYGNMVEIKHKGKLVTRYAHLKDIHTKVGAKVKKGDKIGTVGATGNVRGNDPSHLHFELLKDEQRVDPLKYLYSAEINYKNLKK